MHRPIEWGGTCTRHGWDCSSLSPLIKHDGYRPPLRAATATACAWSPGDGYNWTDLYPWIVEAACKVRQKQFVLDGEAVIFPTAEGLPCKQTRAY